jgi:hypothetical protein
MFTHLHSNSFSTHREKEEGSWRLKKSSKGKLVAATDGGEKL